jgi:dethiobiotin synthetase
MLRSRPPVLVVVAGTGTEVGKTWVASNLAIELRRLGRSVAGRKLAQSFEPPAAPGTTDAEVLAAATGENPTEVCPAWRWYSVAMAPPMAAAALGRPLFDLQDVLEEMSWPPDAAVGLLEQAGGVGSPQAADGDGVDMVAALQPELVVVVAPAVLGTLSNISLALRALGRERLLVYLNWFDSDDYVQVANKRWISERYCVPVATEIPHLARLVAGFLGGASENGQCGGTECASATKVQVERPKN